MFGGREGEAPAEPPAPRAASAIQVSYIEVTTMSHQRQVLFTLFVLAVTAAGVSVASAQHPYGYPWWSYGYGPGRLYRHANARVLPYFALYPPVYYSHSVPRPYGYSPFALPPGMTPAEGIVQPQPKSKEIVNPYYKPPKKKERTQDQATQTARWIVNPYCAKANVALALQEQDR